MFVSKNSKESREVVALWKKLDGERQKMLLSYGEFLLSQQAEGASETSSGAQQVAASPQQPLKLEKPENESAVLALKRLKRSYPMIEADMGLLDDASKLVMERVMGGQDAEIIPRMEALFAARYAAWLEQQ
uniref:Uncharacterized protein n=1 Tax=Magnetococcus massalia (strain MO-1) TaxID=451514 RepID=A0A1S7LD69_MAGMO|nr:conserved protein of unknown function [Candidatus Magnetococcus massalia]